MATESGWETIVPSRQAASTVKEDTSGGWETIAPAAKPTTVVGTFARSGVEAAAATPAALLGAKAGFALAPPVAPIVGPLSKPIGGIVGGIVGGFLGAEGIDAIEGAVDSVFGTNIRATKQQQQQEHPNVALAGQVIGGALNPWMKIGMAGSLKQAATGAGIMAGVGAGTRAVQGGDILDPKAIVADVVSGAFTKPTARGERLLGHTPVADTKPPADALPPETPSKVNSTPEEQKAFLDRLKANKAKKDAQAKVVQAAFKNNETGEIELHGPKHDENRKTETADTHTQGFVDENGNFLDRKEAADRAVNTGQILTEKYTAKEVSEPSKTVESLTKDIESLQKRLDDAERSDAYGTAADTRKEIKILEQKLKVVQEFGPTETKYKDVTKNRAKLERPEDGLHSGDLRTAGDKNFELFNVPETVGGLPVSIDRGMTRSDGSVVGARYKHETNEVSIHPEHTYQQFLDKAWTKPKVEGVFPIAENAFKTAQEWADFVLQHEAEHIKTPKLEGQTKAQYENQTNKAALETLAEKRATETSVERDPKARELIELIRKVAAAEKYSDPKDWTPAEIAAYSKGWEEFSRVRGYNKQEIADFKKYRELTNEMRSKYGDDFVMEFDMLITRGEHPNFPEIKGSVDVEDRLKVDRTKTDPRDVKDLKEFEEIAQEIYEKHGDTKAIEFFEGYKEYMKTWLEPVAETEKFVGINLRNKAANERVTSNNTRDLLDMAGKDVDLNKLTYDIDKGVTLTGKAKEIATKFRELMDALGKKALDNGVINGWHEDYVARNVVSEGDAPPTALKELMNDIFGTGGAKGEGTKTTTKYGKKRVLKTREDLVAHLDGMNAWLAEKGENYRFKLKTDNLAEIYHDYALSVEKAIENKNLVKNLKQVRNVNGEALIREVNKNNPLPYGWKPIDSAQFAGEAVHPDLEPALKFVFDAGPSDLMKALGMISQVTKRMNVIGSFFHAKSMMEVMSSAQIPIWTPIKEALVLPGIEKAVKGLTGKELQLSAISKAVDQYRKGGVGDNVDKWIRESGLQLEIPEDVSTRVLSSMGKFGDSMIGKYGPKTRVLEKSLSTVEKYTLGLFDKYTWDYLHTGGKIMVADAYLDKARIAAAKEGKPFDEAQQRKEIAKFVNNSFGGLNWFDAATQTQNHFAKKMAMAAYSPEGRRGLQVALFAPDWTLSTLRAFTDALPKSLNPAKWHPVKGVEGMMTPTTSSDYARLYQFKTALTYLTVINTLNMLTANRPVWENKDPTRIEWPDGTSMQAMKHAMEPYHWIADPTKTLAAKLGFIPKAMWVGLAETEYASPTAQKIIPEKVTGKPAIDMTIAKAKIIGQSAIPFQAQAAIGSPEGEGVKRALLGTAGFPMYGGTAEQKKIARAERELRAKENAWDYRDKEIESGRMEWTSKHAKDQKALEKQRKKLERDKARQQ